MYWGWPAIFNLMFMLCLDCQCGETTNRPESQGQTVKWQKNNSFCCSTRTLHLSGNHLICFHYDIDWEDRAADPFLAFCNSQEWVLIWRQQNNILLKQRRVWEVKQQHRGADKGGGGGHFNSVSYPGLWIESRHSYKYPFRCTKGWWLYFNFSIYQRWNSFTNSDCEKSLTAYHQLNKNKVVKKVKGAEHFALRFTT